MPHDKDGMEVEPGDIVMVPCRVMQVSKGTDYCNVNLETLEPMFPGEHRSGMTLNSRQVQKLQPLAPVQLLTGTPMADIPRRAQLVSMTPAERAIVDTVVLVENAGTDPRLTDAVVLLLAARESVADFVDGVDKRRFVSESRATDG